MKWFNLRRGQIEGSKHVTVRLPVELSERLDDRARLENKTVTDVITEALQTLLSAPSIMMKDSPVISSAREIKEIELEVERLEREEVYVDAKEKLRLLTVEIQWARGEGESFELVSKDKAERGLYAIEGNRLRRISVSDFDQLVADKAVNERIVAEYDGRIQGLKDKVSSLKAEIVAQ
jgi:hypothetical protein